MIDLEEVLAVAEGYEARKKALIERKVRQDQAYLATFVEGDSVKAFEALRPLVERVRELERQSQVLALAIANDMICAWCWLGKKCPQWDEENVGRATDIVACQKMFLKWAKQAAKEAGE